ncbi:uncharacterized protein LOC120334595 isoform X1 [Styela clava]
MNREDLDDTYDLLSPVRRGEGAYSDSFESSDNESSPQFRSSVSFKSPSNSFKSSSFTASSKIPPPKYASTTRYQQDKPKNLVPSSAPGPSSSPPKRERIIRRTSPLKDCNSHDNTIELMKMPQDGDKKDLSVWEDWLIKKLQQEREDIKIQRQVEKEEKEREERKRMEKEDLKKRAELKHQQWCEEKLLKMKLQTKIEKREQMLKEEMKIQEKREIERKSKQAYERWVEKRNEIEKEQKEKERRKKLEEKQKEDERRRKNEECFQKWLKKVNEKQCASPRQGTVSEYPTPSYRNPAPWIGPLADKDTKESVRRQHKMMIAEKHATIRQRPKTADQKRKGLVKTGPEKGKGVLICRPATAAPLFYNVPIRNPKNFVPEPKRGSFRGRS